MDDVGAENLTKLQWMLSNDLFQDENIDYVKKKAQNSIAE